MPNTPLSDRAITCPHCHAENEIIGIDLPTGSIIHCSQCKAQIGRWSDTRDRFIAAKPLRPALRVEPSAIPHALKGHSPSHD